MNTKLDLLTPSPQFSTTLIGVCDLRPGLRTCGDFEDPGIRSLLAKFPSPSDGLDGQPVKLRLNRDNSLVEEGYVLVALPAHIKISAATAVGAYRALTTLYQWMQLHRHPTPWCAPGLRVEDQPDIPIRGVLLDVSRDKVPTPATLTTLIDQLAQLKINQLQLYMEHTFAYRGHETVWRNASPYTPEEIQELDQYCRMHHIDLVPNQNSFGHFHRWLVHQPYRRLAEVPDGVEHPFSDAVEPFSLCAVDERVPKFLAGLYDQLLPNFSSKLFNVGLDETFDLGRGGSKTQCESRGKTKVYLQFLEKVRDLAAARGRRIQFWGDIIVQHPQMVPLLPKDAIALEWGYEADHPFPEHAARFADSGLDFYVCPGTGSWNSIGGRITNTLANLKAAAEAAHNHGAAGYLITDWGDYGHLQPYPVSLPGLVAGAAAAWRKNDPLHHPNGLIQRLNHLIFDEPADTPGEALVHLGRVCDDAACQPKNGTAPFFLLRFAKAGLQHERLTGLSAEDLAVIQEKATQISAGLNRCQTKDQQQMRAEIKLAADLISWLCRFGQARFQAGIETPISAVSSDLKQSLADDMEAMLPTYRDLWLKRNRSGGLEDSTARLSGLIHALR